ncbi:MAG: acyloxyacyl hydrolase [Bacteroidetes bacterium]|nr:acyloxyacyl hydrolase [Bacteroidota bacterium]
MKFFKIIFLTLVFCLATQFVSAQDSLPKNNFAPALIIYPAYTPKTYPSATNNYVSVLIGGGINFKLNGKDKWHQHYNFPFFGFDLFYGMFDKSSELGQVIGFTPCMQISNAKNDRKMKLKIGLGAAYFNKPYNVVSNPNNFYIGSHFTNMTAISVLWERKLQNNFYFSYGAGIVHFSNGHTRLPNVGLNLISLNTGIRFNKNNATYTHKIDSVKNRITYAVKLGLGMHSFGETTKAIGGPDYPSYHVSLYASKPSKQIHIWQAGITLAYYTSFYDYIRSQQMDYKNPRMASSTALIFAGHEFVFGKFALSTQLGIYCYNSFYIRQKKLSGNWDGMIERIEAFNTNRLGLMYYPLKKKNTLNKLNNQLFFGVFIKANFAQADLFEYSVGYVF